MNQGVLMPWAKPGAVEARCCSRKIAGGVALARAVQPGKVVSTPMLKSATITPIAIKNRTTRLTTSDATKVMQRQTMAIAHPSRTVGVQPKREPMLSPIQARSVNFATPPTNDLHMRCGHVRLDAALAPLKPPLLSLATTMSEGWGNTIH
jgi:hypothetical protein